MGNLPQPQETAKDHGEDELRKLAAKRDRARDAWLRVLWPPVFLMSVAELEAVVDGENQ